MRTDVMQRDNPRRASPATRPKQAGVLGRSHRAHWTVALSLLAMLPGCRQDSTPRTPDNSPAPLQGTPWFEDVTSSVGIQFRHDAGVHGDYRMHEHIGSGCALFDFDNDGRLDLYLVQNGGPGSAFTNQLYRQLSNGSFANVSAQSGLDVTGYGMGVAIGDVNNDGWRDVALTEYGAVRLFLNAGNGTFKEISRDAGLMNPRWATAASFLDYDRDGWLDLVVGNYVDFDPTHKCYDAQGRRDYCGVDRAPPTLTRLFHNLGAAPHANASNALDSPPVRFEDVTVGSGLVHYPGQALGVVCLDFNADHWPDIFLADDERPNRLFINQRNGTFTEEAAPRGLAYNALGQVAANMGVAIADVDANGLYDLFITHLSAEFHNLWRQETSGLFLDRTAESGLTRIAWRGTGFGTVLADFDLDGDEDIALVNGRIKRDPAVRVDANSTTDVEVFWAPYAERSQVFANDGQGRFIDVSTEHPDLSRPLMVGRGLACGDLDNDGDLDMVVTAIGGPARVFRNTMQGAGYWLLIETVDPQYGGRDAYGAEIRVVRGNRSLWRVIQPGYSYLSSNDPRAHFGLGTSERVDAIEIAWPDGSLERFPGVPANQLLRLVKGAGSP